MGKTLGLNDDYWHGILPAVVYIILIPVIFLSFGTLSALHLLADLILLLGLIQFSYEWLQAIDPYVHLKYGDWIGFQVNTKKDIRLFIIGSFVGIFVGFLVYAILVNYVFVPEAINLITPEPATIPPAR